MLAYNYTCNDVGYGATSLQQYYSIKPVECLLTNNINNIKNKLICIYSFWLHQLFNQITLLYSNTSHIDENILISDCCVSINFQANYTVFG